jgi:drug/metabolite transporter (DMT)-like permease
MTSVRHDNIRAAGFMTLSTVFFSVNDAAMKFISQEIPMLQAMAVRGLMVTLGLGILAHYSGALRSWRKLGDPIVVARSSFETIGSFAFMLSLAHIPLATAISLNMATPLVVLPLAAMFLGERYGWRRIGAIIVGFFGVMLILQPSSDGVDPWLMLSFSSSLFFAMRDVSTRRISADIPSLMIALAMAGIVTVTTGIWSSVVDGWIPIDGRQLALLGIAAVMVGFGYTLVVKAMRLGEVSFTGAFRYTALLWGTLFGWLIWREMPNATAWVGIFLILAAGLYALHRERIRAHRP